MSAETPDLTPETLAEWDDDAEHFREAVGALGVSNVRILALIRALAAEKVARESAERKEKLSREAIDIYVSALAVERDLSNAATERADDWRHDYEVEKARVAALEAELTQAQSRNSILPQLAQMIVKNADRR